MHNATFLRGWGCVVPGATWKAIYEVAAEQHGLFSTDDGRRIGVPGAYLRQMVARGTLDRVARGIYGVPEVHGGHARPFRLAVMWAGDGSVLEADAVLSLLGLADANPRVLRVVSPRPVRRQDPPVPMQVRVAAVAPADVTMYLQVPCLRVGVALREALDRGLVMPSRIRDAVGVAEADGMLRPGEAEALNEHLDEGREVEYG